MTEAEFVKKLPMVLRYLPPLFWYEMAMNKEGYEVLQRT
jgi:hypothetical protein